MKIEGRTYRENYTTHVIVVKDDHTDLRFSKQLENCLIEICRQLDVSPPLWMEKNTHEFAAWHQTIFSADQFMETVPFTRLQIKWLEEEN